jgi:hypothetical protein
LCELLFVLRAAHGDSQGKESRINQHGGEHMMNRGRTAAAAAAAVAGFVNIGSAGMIGMIAAVVCALVQEAMDRFGKKYIDDTLDVWACHGVGELPLCNEACTLLALDTSHCLHSVPHCLQC